MNRDDFMYMRIATHAVIETAFAAASSPPAWVGRGLGSMPDNRFHISSATDALAYWETRFAAGRRVTSHVDALAELRRQAREVVP